MITIDLGDKKLSYDKVIRKLYLDGELLPDLPRKRKIHKVVVRDGVIFC